MPSIECFFVFSFERGAACFRFFEEMRLFNDFGEFPDEGALGGDGGFPDDGALGGDRGAGAGGEFRVSQKQASAKTEVVSGRRWGDGRDHAVMMDYAVMDHVVMMMTDGAEYAESILTVEAGVTSNHAEWAIR